MEGYSLSSKIFIKKWGDSINSLFGGYATEKVPHRYIYDHFYTTLKKLSANVIWVDDDKNNKSVIEKNDLITSINIAGYNLPIIGDVYYCLHNFDEIGNSHSKLEPSKNIRLQVYTNASEKADEKWDEVIFF